MTSIETLDFSSNANSSMVALDKPVPAQSNSPPPHNNVAAPPPQPGAPHTGGEGGAQANYNDQRKNVADNNIDKEQMMELSTPLNEVMEIQADPMQQQAGMQMMQQQGPGPQQQMFAPGPDASMFSAQPPNQDAQAEQAQAAKKSNPGNLSDEQFDALLVAVAAAAAFSPQIRDKMIQFAPQLFTEAGSRTLAGTAVTAAAAGGVFLLAKRLL